jgi:hypothetical protein
VGGSPGAAHRGILERLYGDGPDSMSAAPSIADFLEEFSDEIRFTA